MDTRIATAVGGLLAEIFLQLSFNGVCMCVWISVWESWCTCVCMCASVDVQQLFGSLEQASATVYVNFRIFCILKATFPPLSTTWPSWIGFSTQFTSFSWWSSLSALSWENSTTGSYSFFLYFCSLRLFFFFLSILYHSLFIYQSIFRSFYRSTYLYLLNGPSVYLSISASPFVFQVDFYLFTHTFIHCFLPGSSSSPRKFRTVYPCPRCSSHCTNPPSRTFQTTLPLPIRRLPTQSTIPQPLPLQMVRS